ncbi:putative F-box domain-containing protein [Medicago truncatula]|uniref:Putative F-box domain-containing protein n=1 Tax=Medicago truncatula TaxID=3880 RepID=A0A396JFY5_MEDTR|nr:F-box protein SKIP23 [Medicago truncatula]RHN77156.1 putative F-box domain-containing protein [Medicago truncatula]
MKKKKENPQNTPTATSMAESDWSSLPKELLHLISQRLDVELDLIRFRSTCSTWRSSSLPIPNLTLKFPHPYQSSINNTTQFHSLSKRSFFLIKPPLQRPWLIKITQNPNGKTKLLHPLLSYQSSHPLHFPHALDFSELYVLELGNDYIIDSEQILPCDYVYPEKIVAVTCKEKGPLVIGTFISTKKSVSLKTNGDEIWCVITDMSINLVDICVFKGRPYMIDGIVESEGALLRVDIYECLGFDYSGKDVLRINVFRFDEKECKWADLMSLGDRVLFLGNGCSFSASASDLCVSKGNCVIFIDDAFLNFNGKNMQYGNCVFDLDQGKLSPLSDCPDYFNLFWPPAEWIGECCVPK